METLERRKVWVTKRKRRQKKIKIITEYQNQIIKVKDRSWLRWGEFKLLFTPMCGGIPVPERTVFYPPASLAAIEVTVMDLAAA